MEVISLTHIPRLFTVNLPLPIIPLKLHWAKLSQVVASSVQLDPITCKTLTRVCFCLSTANSIRRSTRRSDSMPTSYRFLLSPNLTKTQLHCSLRSCNTNQSPTSVRLWWLVKGAGFRFKSWQSSGKTFFYRLKYLRRASLPCRYSIDSNLLLNSLSDTVSIGQLIYSRWLECSLHISTSTRSFPKSKSTSKSTVFTHGSRCSCLPCLTAE